MIKLKNLSGALLLCSMFAVGCQSGAGDSNTDDSDSTAMATDSSDAMQSMDQEPQALDSVSNDDLQKFTSAVTSIQMYSQTVQPRMINVVQKNGLTPQRYSMIMQSQQMPNDTLQVSDDEMAKFKDAQAKIETLQNNANDTIEMKIKQSGLTVDHYRAILATVRQDPALQQKVQAMQAQQMQSSNPPAVGK